ncbi:hypothetical protein BWP24_28090 (plasmid) [Vibrio campbellii]|nr:hypothetical protein BWP24_28090 [Vibrio campbellii]
MNNESEKQNIFDRDDGREVTSLVLTQLDPDQLPKSQTSCQVCPLGVWMTEANKKATELKVYCRLMNCFTWTTTQNINITNCDGLMMTDEDDEMEE